MLSIDRTVSDTYPGAQMGILAMRGVDAKAPLDPLIVSQAMEEIRRRYGQLDRAALKTLHPVKAYVDYYRAFGYSYHVLAQLESVLSGKRTVGNGPSLLSAMFLTELESMLLTAGHDLDMLQTPLRLSVASGDEHYMSISGKDVQTVVGDLMVFSGNDVISSILRGPDANSKITASTTGVLFTLYAPPGIETDAVDGTLHALENRIRSCSAGSQTVSLTVYSCD